MTCATFASSLWPADFQGVVSSLDFGWSPERISLTPRFGYNVVDLKKMTTDITTNMLDKRFSQSVVDQLRVRGLSVSQADYVDTGMLVTINRDPATGILIGFTPEQLSNGKAEGY